MVIKSSLKNILWVIRDAALGKYTKAYKINLDLTYAL